uniref:Uncharacterized protein n=1 Tax=Anguilla anguilla TaxID=7936 RepID=A0A0E9PJF8_ANGAN
MIQKHSCVTVYSTKSLQLLVFPGPSQT